MWLCAFAHFCLKKSPFSSFLGNGFLFTQSKMLFCLWLAGIQFTQTSFTNGHSYTFFISCIVGKYIWVYLFEIVRFCLPAIALDFFVFLFLFVCFQQVAHSQKRNGLGLLNLNSNWYLSALPRQFSQKTLETASLSSILFK